MMECESRLRINNLPPVLRRGGKKQVCLRCYKTFLSYGKI